MIIKNLKHTKVNINICFFDIINLTNLIVFQPFDNTYSYNGITCILNEDLSKELCKFHVNYITMNSHKKMRLNKNSVAYSVDIDEIALCNPNCEQCSNFYI